MTGLEFLAMWVPHIHEDLDLSFGDLEVDLRDAFLEVLKMRRKIEDERIALLKSWQPHSGFQMHAERIIGPDQRSEGKHALNWTRLSCHDFPDNQVRLQLFLLAYNLANFLRRLAALRAPATEFFLWVGTWLTVCPECSEWHRSTEWRAVFRRMARFTA